MTIFVIVVLIIELGAVMFRVLFFKKNVNNSIDYNFNIPINNLLYSYEMIDENYKLDINYYRDIPCNNDIYQAYFISKLFLINTNRGQFIGAVILNWFRLGAIKFESVKSSFFNRKNIRLIFVFNPKINELDYRLYNLMKNSSKDGILDTYEFKEWCKKNSDEIIQWFNDIDVYERSKLINENKIVTKIINTDNYKTKKYVLQPELISDVRNLLGLKKFLLSFTNINNKDFNETQLLNYYIIYAQFLGIAKKTNKIIRKIYPNYFIEKDLLNYKEIYAYIDHIESITSYSYSTSYTNQFKDNDLLNNKDLNHLSSSDEYSSGGGGYSSGGGGSGSSGGGGGGGGFR